MKQAFKRLDQNWNQVDQNQPWKPLWHSCTLWGTQCAELFRAPVLVRVYLHSGDYRFAEKVCTRRNIIEKKNNKCTSNAAVLL